MSKKGMTFRVDKKQKKGKLIKKYVSSFYEFVLEDIEKNGLRFDLGIANDMKNENGELEDKED